jgi:MATE family multidrug resistance protein
MNAHAREILQLALPSIVSNITVPLLGLADVAIMGHIGNARYIGAIAVGSMIFNVIYWLFGFLRMGTSGLTAQAYGARQPNETASVLRRSLTVALSAGVLILLFQWPIRLLALWLMRPSQDVALLVTPYFNICVWGAPAMLGLYALTGWFVGMQNTRIPMVVAIGQNILNIMASVAFVFALGMQVEGVALGTVLAQWAGFIAALLLAGKLLPQRTLLLKTHGGYGRFFRVNRDIFLRTLCLVTVNFYFTSAGAAQGAMTLAVNTLLMQFFLLFSYFLDGFAYAGEALSGRYYGAGNRRALSHVVSSLFGWGALMVVLFTLIYWLGGSTFLQLLTSDRSVTAAASHYYNWVLLIPICGVAAFVWDGIYIGLTATRGMLWASFLALVVFFAVWWSLAPVWGNHALWLALLLFLAVRGVVQTLLFRFRPLEKL